MKKRYVLKNKARFTLILVTLSLVLLSTLFAGRVYGYKQPEYKVITVKDGDTLWDIAGKYNKRDDIRKYIYEIKKVNKLTSSEIFAGDQLRVQVEY